MDVLLFFMFCISLAGAADQKAGSKKKIKYDKEHLKFDFSGIFGSIASLFSDSEMDFRYFAAHDYDRNKKLDGLELFSAMTHDNEHAHENSSDEKQQTLEDIERQVDDMFREHDGNHDGFLDYVEFASAQRDPSNTVGQRRS